MHRFLTRKFIYFTAVASGLVVIGATTGCATASEAADDYHFSDRVEQSLSKDLFAPSVTTLMKERLTLSDALRLAIANNPELQAQLVDLNIAEANRLQAGLIENPEFEAQVLFSHESSDKKRTEFALHQDVLSIITSSTKKKIATIEYGKVQKELANAILKVTLDVRTGYHTLQAAEKTLSMHRRIAEASSIASDFAKRQYSAGNISKLHYSIEKAAGEEAAIELGRRESETRLAREELNRLLGLSDKNKHWQIAEQLESLPGPDPEIDELQARATVRRLDIAILRQQQRLVNEELKLVKSQIIPSLAAGVVTESEDGERFTGGVISVGLPIFDQRQGDIALKNAELKKISKLLEKLEVQARYEVKIAHEHLDAARKEAEAYRDRVVPLKQEIVKLFEEEYNYMLSGVYQLLEAKQGEIQSQEDYIMALRDYWIARAELERAVGEQIPTTEPLHRTTRPTSQSASQPASQPSTEHHMHQMHNKGEES